MLLARLFFGKMERWECSKQIAFFDDLNHDDDDDDDNNNNAHSIQYIRVVLVSMYITGCKSAKKAT
jgi:hypothetical protein